MTAAEEINSVRIAEKLRSANTAIQRNEAVASIKVLVELFQKLAGF